MHTLKNYKEGMWGRGAEVACDVSCNFPEGYHPRGHPGALSRVLNQGGAGCKENWLSKERSKDPGVGAGCVDTSEGPSVQGRNNLQVPVFGWPSPKMKAMGEQSDRSTCINLPDTEQGNGRIMALEKPVPQLGTKQS